MECSAECNRDSDGERIIVERERESCEQYGRERGGVRGGDFLRSGWDVHLLKITDTRYAELRSM